MLLDEFENSSKNDKKEAPTHPETSTPKRNRELFNLITTPSFVRENLETPKSKVHTNRALREMNLDENTILHEYEPVRTIGLTTRSHALPEVLLLHPRVLEDDSSMEEDLQPPVGHAEHPVQLLEHPTNSV
ncbi:hypothetical protein BLNAU_2783 [Blattamonas nauphoetae]|uniref:Uncharacterized protein n=1 Tax=Blattamonas nauphoetae TaxID=2049346 RepID=A0ABQ9YEK0_9EUKA|nr:hypothetical protein BLNAU_2783 [Blattamonas nauphoetae]